MGLGERMALMVGQARRLLAVAIAVAGAVAVWLPASAASAGAPGAPVAPDANGQVPAGWVNTQWGPYGPADVALLQNVRLANLWEGEGAAPMGMQKGASERVRQVGKILGEQHAGLEVELQKVAAKLGVALPTQPNADQRTWLGEMAAATGPAFDQVWVARLRAAHGKIFSLIATVRANTRNSVVRGYAEAANKAVSTHMGLLESTGLVAYNSLPTPASPAAAAAGAARGAQAAADGPLIRPASSVDGGLSPMVIWLLLLAALAGGGVLMVRVIRAR